MALDDNNEIVLRTMNKAVTSVFQHGLRRLEVDTVKGHLASSVSRPKKATGAWGRRHSTHAENSCLSRDTGLLGLCATL